MAAFELEVSVKGVHCIPKTWKAPFKISEKLWNYPVKGFIFNKVAG